MVMELAVQLHQLLAFGKAHLAVVDGSKNREDEKWADDVDGNLDPKPKFSGEGSVFLL